MVFESQLKILESLAVAQFNAGEEDTSKETKKRAEQFKAKHHLTDSDTEADSQDVDDDLEKTDEEDVDFDLLLESGRSSIGWFRLEASQLITERPTEFMHVS